MTQRKNICLTINSLDSGGAEKQCLLLAKALQPHHNTILVILNSEPVYPPRLEMIKEEGLKHIFLAGNAIKKIISFKRELKNRNIEIIFSFLPTDTIMAAICGRLAGVKYLFGGIRNSYVASFKFATLRFIHNHFLTYTISNNHAAYHSAMAYGFKNNLMVIANGIEMKPQPLRKKTNNDVVTIISVGRLVQQKGYETAIKSISSLKKNIRPGLTINYKIVGQGPEQANIARAMAKYDLKDEVELITSPSNIYKLLESSDIYLCTSVFEGISNSIMEAMNCGLPIVATAAGDNSRLVINNKNGFITDLYDYQKIADHLCYLIESPAVSKQMGLESHKYLARHFGYGDFQKKYLGLIDRIEDIRVQDGELLI